jgi:hypothetical protein
VDTNNLCRKRAAEAQAMADKVIGADDKAALLRVAQGWLSLIKMDQAALEKFDAVTKLRGTGQDVSKGPH